MRAAPEAGRAQSAQLGHPFPSVRWSVIFLLCLAATAACGGSSHSGSRRPRNAASVCSSVQSAAARLLGHGTKTRIVDHDRTNIKCLVTRTGVRTTVTAQALAQAWTQFDTTVVHYAQAFGSSQLPDSSRVPQDMVIAGANAAWIPGQQELFATNGTESQGGSYVTVVVSGSAARGAAALRLARVVTAATLASAPRGPSPGPAPS